ncbi:hypothetical protein B0H14DRAFT_2578367 [Mycena olivaceomarginata]|nr:hypothetical protein B0H14DRAFT_2578367 [Mycena olivaceomarginata]
MSNINHQIQPGHYIISMFEHSRLKPLLHKASQSKPSAIQSGAHSSAASRIAATRRLARSTRLYLRRNQNLRKGNPTALGLIVFRRTHHSRTRPPRPPPLQPVGDSHSAVSRWPDPVRLTAETPATGVSMNNLFEPEGYGFIWCRAGRQANIAIGLCVETISALDGEGAEKKILRIHAPWTVNTLT